MNKRYIDFVPTANEEAAEPKKTVTRKISVSGTGRANPRVRRTGAVRRVDSVVRVKPARGVRRTAAPKAASVAKAPSVAKPRKASGVVRAAGVRKVSPGAVSVRRAPAKTRVAVTRKSVVRMNAATFTDEKKTKKGEIEDLSRHFVKTEVAKRPLSQPAPRPKLSLIEKFNARQSKAQRKESKKSTPEVDPEKKLLETYKAPNSPFINQGNIEKRPLSRTVYTKKVVVPKEKKQEPVTIITKPEKQSHVGVVVAVILTIILGAAAGTVAFLLLPK